MSDRFNMDGQVLIKKSVPTVLRLNQYKTLKIIDAVTIAASGNSSSSAIEVNNLDGFFSMQWTVTGNGTCKFEVLTSLDGTNFLDLSTDIAIDQTKTTGPGSDGINGAYFQIMLCNVIKIKTTETGGANSVTITAYVKGK